MTGPAKYEKWWKGHPDDYTYFGLEFRFKQLTDPEQEDWYETGCFDP